MPQFKLVQQHTDLPQPGPTTRIIEGDTFDFKETYAPAKLEEMGKDIAMFANGLGGTIVVGSSPDADPLAYPGLPRAYAEERKTDFDLALRDFVDPKPLVVSVLFESPIRPGYWMLVVNVYPYPDQLVGSRVGSCWRFPMRTGAQCAYISPSMIALYSAAVRRIAILLEGISVGSSVELIFVNTQGVITGTGMRHYVAIDHRTNVLKVEERSAFTTRAEWHPLDQVKTAYLGSDSVWRVKLPS